MKKTPMPAQCTWDAQEMEFQASPQTAIEALIHINNQLRQPEAAVGVLTYAQVCP